MSKYLQLIAILLLAPAAAQASPHRGWELVDGDGQGTTGAKAQDLDLPTDADGLPIYPSKSMCLSDLRDSLHEAEQSTPLVDQDAVAANDMQRSKDAHCVLENRQRAECVPYVKGKYVLPNGPDYVCPWNQ